MSIRAKDKSRFCEKLTDIYVCFTITVFSLFCFPNYSSITEWKFKVFFWSTLIYFALLVFGSLELRLVGSTADAPNFYRLRSVVFFALMSYLLLAVLSFAFSEHRSSALFGGGKFDGLLSILLYFLSFTLVVCFGRLKCLHIIALIPVVLLNFVLILLQFFGFNPLSLYPDGMNYHDAFKLYANEFLGTFGNVDILSAFLSMAIPLFLAMAVFGDNRLKRLFAVLLLPASFCLFICKVYLGIFGTFVAVFIMAFYIKESSEFKDFIRYIALILISAILALLLLDTVSVWYLIILFCIALLAFLPIRFNRRIFLFLFSAAFITLFAVFIFFLLKDRNSDSGRLRIWKDAIRIFLENPLLGSGPGTFLNESSFCFERYSEELGIMIKSSVDAAHNIYLHILSCMGLPALIAYLAFVFSVIKRARSSLLLFPIISFLISSLFFFEVCSASAIFYIICGLAVCDKTKQ